ncbi:MAG TPA: VCBS repeat-containing protein, partial [Armatimonadota bacterium]|nr:VCBS repeat-containing protein [Armatimonadota bacterium]
FAAYRNASEQPGVKLAVDIKPMTPDEAGYAVGTPADLLHPGGNVMFPDGRAASVDVDLGRRRELTRFVVKSRQLVTFNGGCGVRSLQVLVGDEGFRDMRPVAERQITDKLQDALVEYSLPAPAGTMGRYVRIIVEPYTEAHNVYLESLQIEGVADRSELLPGELHQNALEVADLDGDGRDEVLAAGTDKRIHAIAPDGSGLWSYDTGSVINALAVNDDTGKGDYTIAAACEDQTLYAVGEDGAEAWTVTPPPRTYARPGYRGVKPFQGRLTVAFAADLQGDGPGEIIVGSANWRTYCYSHAGELLWDEVLWAHTPTCGAACDLDGDGVREVIMGNSYTSTVIYASDGKILGSGRGSGHAGPTALACGDLDGNGLGDMVVGDRAGKLWFQEWKGRDLPNWSTGTDVTDVALADVDGDGRVETAAASRNNLLYLFDADGQPIWQLNLLDVCRDIDVGDVTGDGAPDLVCACEDGTVKVVSAGGEVVAWYRGGGWFRQVRVCELDGDPASREIAATCDDGAVYGLRVTR